MSDNAIPHFVVTFRAVHVADLAALPHLALVAHVLAVVLLIMMKKKKQLSMHDVMHVSAGKSLLALCLCSHINCIDHHAICCRWLCSRSIQSQRVCVRNAHHYKDAVRLDRGWFKTMDGGWRHVARSGRGAICQASLV